MKFMEKMEAQDWVPGPAYFMFFAVGACCGPRGRTADGGDFRGSSNISIAKAMSCDPVFGAGQGLDQVSEAVQADAKLATENAKS